VVDKVISKYGLLHRRQFWPEQLSQFVGQFVDELVQIPVLERVNPLRQLEHVELEMQEAQVGRHF
jgi:hypothetical protein